MSGDDQSGDDQRSQPDPVPVEPPTSEAELELKPTGVRLRVSGGRAPAHVVRLTMIMGLLFVGIVSGVLLLALGKAVVMAVAVWGICWVTAGGMAALWHPEPVVTSPPREDESSA